MSKDYTDEDIKRGFAICDAATDAPWRQTFAANNAGIPLADFYIPGYNNGASVEMIEEDAVFIVTARTGWPRALAALVEERRTLDGRSIALDLAIKRGNDFADGLIASTDRIAVLEAELVEARRDLAVRRGDSIVTAEVVNDVITDRDARIAALEADLAAAKVSLSEWSDTQAAVVDSFRVDLAERTRERDAALNLDQHTKHDGNCPMRGHFIRGERPCTCGLDAAREMAGL